MTPISELPESTQEALRVIFLKHISGTLAVDKNGWCPDGIRLINEPKTDDYILMKMIWHEDREDQVAVFRLAKSMTNKWLEEE